MGPSKGPLKFSLFLFGLLLPYPFRKDTSDITVPIAHPIGQDIQIPVVPKGTAST